MNKVIYVLLIGIILYLLYNPKQVLVEPIDFKNQEFTTKTIDSLKLEIINQEAIISNTQKQAIQLIDEKNKELENFKRINSITRAVKTTSIRDTFLKLDTIKELVINKDTVLLACGSFKDAWASIDICSNDSVAYVKDISFTDTTTIVITKSGFLKTKYNVTSIHNSPYVSTNSFNSVVVNKKNKNHLVVKSSLVALGIFIGFLVF
jgi:hypothetical protein